MTILDEAKELIYGDRQRVYGSPIDDFSRTALMWTAILGVTVTPEQVALCMCAVKMSRLCNGYKRDSVVDLAGYAGTYQMVIEERHRRQLASTTKPA